MTSRKKQLHLTMRRALAAFVFMLPMLPLMAQPAGADRYANSKWDWNNWFPPLASEEGADLDKLFYYITYLTSVVFVGVFVCLIAFLFLYREKPGSGRRARYTHGNNMVELIWTLIPALILVGVAFMAEQKWAYNKKQLPDPTESNQYLVEAYQFGWDVTYPGKDGEIGTDDDFTIPTLHLEAGKPSVVTLTSRDVIHSFFLPDFRVKQDAMPGRAVQIWFTPTVEGSYQIACAEFCGNGHTNMKGIMQVHNPEKFAETMATEIEMAELYGGGGDSDW